MSNLVKHLARRTTFLPLALFLMIPWASDGKEAPADMPIGLDDQVKAYRETEKQGGDESLFKEHELVSEYEKRAGQGDLEAQHQLGRYYYFVEMWHTDFMCYDKAAEWYRKAADQGYAKSQNNLAVCYFNGKGVPKNQAEGLKWLRKAADGGLAISQNSLGFRYLRGDGVSKDDTEAAKWFRKAADQGFTQAQNNLGIFYYQGKGVPKDRAEALKWLRKADGQQITQTVTAQKMPAESIRPAQPKNSEGFLSGRKIPKIVALNGTTYTDVMIRSRDSGSSSVRISHTDGFTTLLYSELERSSAELLGVLEMEKEKIAKEIAKKKAADDKSKADHENAMIDMEIQSLMLKALKNMELKEVADWALMAEIDKAYTVEKLKILFGRPPDFSSESLLHWSNICWNPITEKMDDLDYTTESGSIPVGRDNVLYISPVFKCGGQTVRLARPCDLP